MRSITVTCPECGATYAYISYEYSGEFLICKGCKGQIFLRDIYDSLSDEDKDTLWENRVTRQFIKRIRPEEE